MKMFTILQFTANAVSIRSKTTIIIKDDIRSYEITSMPMRLWIIQTLHVIIIIIINIIKVA